MINNAGIMARAPLERLTIDDWNRTIDINIKGEQVCRARARRGAAAEVIHMSQPREVDVNEILFRPTGQML